MPQRNPCARSYLHRALCTVALRALSGGFGNGSIIFGKAPELYLIDTELVERLFIISENENILVLTGEKVIICVSHNVKY